VPAIIVDEKTRPKKRARSRNGVNPVNPPVPPFEDADEEP
jgi:hypothetical protein